MKNILKTVLAIFSVLWLAGCAGLADAGWFIRYQPDYYRVTGPAVITDVCPAKGVRYTGKIDALNRIGPVCGIITKTMVDNARGHRQPWAKNSNPAGWGYNAEVDILQTDGKYYHGWFWNKSHLLANSLGGDANFLNNVMGTRMQNVGAGEGGMAYAEGKVREYLRTNPRATVTYLVTPIYRDNELIPREVTVDMLSSDRTINEHVVTLNQVYGFTIDYYNGQFFKN
ncbi:MAG: DNA/RNA non-specific endonuclease [Microbacteriaceae bacterium]|nr:DNA/RNA non-specific endonuclease [Microbacteriaceae bacterium]